MDDVTLAMSRLLDGDLPPDEAQALKKRIEHEPEVAAMWEVMQALPQDLGDLPVPVVPEGLNQGLNPGVPQEAKPRWVPWALVAALLLALLVPRDPPAIVLLEGRQVVDGTTLVLAGPTSVVVDGRAEISVEPIPGTLRVDGAEDQEMTRNILAALSGAVVTVAVYEGRATITSGADEVVVEAGEQHRTSPKRPQTATQKAGGPHEVPPQALTERIEALEAQLAEARLQNAWNAGQRKAMEGEVRPWPASLPETLLPGAFEEKLSDLAEGSAADVLEVDCSEYPCMAVLRYTGEGDGREALDGLRDAFEQAIGQELSARAGVTRAETDNWAETLFSLSLWPDGMDKPDETRMDHRERDATQDAMYGLHPEE